MKNCNYYSNHEIYTKENRICNEESCIFLTSVMTNQSLHALFEGEATWRNQHGQRLHTETSQFWDDCKNKPVKGGKYSISVVTTR